MRVILISWVAVCSFFASSAWASDFQPSRSAEESVAAGVELVLSVVRKYENRDDDASRAAFLEEVSSVLEPVIGFAVITRRVMGDAYEHATREQKIRFLETFERSLIDTYAGGLFSLGDYKVEVLPSQNKNEDTLKNTLVYLQVINPKGSTYSMVQSVYYSRSADDWKMQNVIFNGINLGITFRTQFEQIYEQTNGDLDLTIDEWERITEESYHSTKFQEG